MVNRVSFRLGSSLRLCAAIALAAIGCAAPTLTRDGQVVFSEGGANGASVLTANGVEFMDRNVVPTPVLRRSINEPWRPATGFLLPADGIWRHTSTPMAAEGHGLLVVLRSSDALVPSWGGEVLLRLDAIVPAAAFPAVAASVRAPRRLVIVVDGHEPGAAALIDAALENLGERDRVALVDTARARTVVPLLPGTHRTLLRGAVQRVTATPVRGVARDLPAALALARGWLASRAVEASAPSPAAPTSAAVRQVLLVTDGAGVARGGARLGAQVNALRGAGARLTGVAQTDDLEAEALAPLGTDLHAGGSVDERAEAVDAAVPPPGDVALRDVALSISSVPAPARVIEVSGGLSALALDADHLWLGEMYAGEARTEVARVAVPVWVPGEPLELVVTATYRDVASGERLTARTVLKARYSAEVAEIASARHGDVIAYASALAMVRRLDRAFAGSSIDRLGGLRPVVAWQARSLGTLARQTHDPALGAQAEVLDTLLSAIPD
jgi:hypothetical protein